MPLDQMKVSVQGKQCGKHHGIPWLHRQSFPLPSNQPSPIGVSPLLLPDSTDVPISSHSLPMQQPNDIYSLINICVCVWEKRQEMLEEKEEKPGSLTVPVTWYPDRRSRLTSQDARKPEAPVTQTLPLNSILLSMPCLIDATFRSNYYRTVAFLVAC